MEAVSASDLQHKFPAEGRWNELSLVELLANVGSEVTIKATHRE